MREEKASMERLLKEYFEIDEKIKAIEKQKNYLKEIIKEKFERENKSSMTYILEGCDKNANIIIVNRRSVSPNMEIIKKYVPDSVIDEAVNAKVTSSITIRKIDKNKTSNNDKYAGVISDIS